MPRASLTEAQIAETREKILDTAAEIISEEGFQALSMRKIGTRVGMTAANIYNYYAGKDEINIAIRLRAGVLLYGELLAAWETEGNLVERLWEMVRAYLRFGLFKPHYYAIMFDMPTPKYSYYVGTALEDLALQEKESSVQNIDLMRRCTLALKEGGLDIPEEPEVFTTMVWGHLHGLVSLHNNQLLAEVVSNPEEAVEDAARAAYEGLLRRGGYPFRDSK